MWRPKVTSHPLRSIDLESTPHKLWKTRCQIRHKLKLEPQTILYLSPESSLPTFDKT